MSSTMESLHISTPMEKLITNTQGSLYLLKDDIENQSDFNSENFIEIWNLDFKGSKSFLSKSDRTTIIFNQLSTYEEFHEYIESMGGNFSKESYIINFFLQYGYFYHSDAIASGGLLFEKITQKIRLNQVRSYLDEANYKSIGIDSIQQINLDGIVIVEVDDLDRRNNGYTIFNCIIINKTQTKRVYEALGIMDYEVSKRLVLSNELGNLIYNAIRGNDTRKSELFSDYCSIGQSSLYIRYLTQLYLYSQLTNQERMIDIYGLSFAILNKAIDEVTLQAGIINELQSTLINPNLIDQYQVLESIARQFQNNHIAKILMDKEGEIAQSFIKYAEQEFKK